MGFHVLVKRTTGQTDHLDLPTVDDALASANQAQQELGVVGVSVFSPEWRVISNLNLAVVQGRLGDSLQRRIRPN